MDNLGNIRFILIVAFCTLVFMLWQAWQLDYGPKPAMPMAETAVPSVKEDLPVTSTGEASAQTPEEPAASSPTAENTAAAAAQTNLIHVKTDLLELDIDTKGGTIRNLDLLAYAQEKENTVVKKLRETVGLPPSEKNLSPVRLFNSDNNKLFIAESGILAGAGSAVAPSHHSMFTSAQNQYDLQEGQDDLVVNLSWTDNQGLTVNKTYTFKRGSYVINLDQKIDNRTGKAWTGRQYTQLLRLPPAEENNNAFIRTYTGGAVYTQKDKFQKVDFDDMASKNLDQTSQGGWSGMIQHYFAAAWIPPGQEENHFYSKSLQDSRFVIGSYSPETSVADQSEAVLSTRLFAGPKIQPMMETIAQGLELTVDYSWLTFIAKYIYLLLEKIHGVVNNWALAIIGVTLVIKLLFFKLSQASYKSMAKMRKIQPRLKELQERYADDRQRFNQEMMAMYKREKVNPLGGCLPMLVQIPVFISLYWVLVETVELRQAPFMLWIQDLSAQDPFYILPILYGISMKIQQSLNPTPVDPVQAKVTQMFPIVFTVFFLFFPAGLVLYWIVNNTLSILQQWYITRSIEQAK
ncbi:MAG: membrane protein insertase YidC [Methylobacter sp.]|nr:MAG: membrane protein insertase YidC [Methylobacter sp.]